MIRQKFLSRRFDEAGILTSLTTVAFTTQPTLAEGDYFVLAALRRSSDEWRQLTIEETSERLAAYDDASIGGLVNNVKGILHEMEFVKLENEDGDSVFASLYPHTNHKGVDVQLHDEESGESWDIQSKATDSTTDVNDWMASNPDTEIVVTEELADKLGLQSSGFSNEGLTVRVEDFVDRMIGLDQTSTESLWNYFPVLVAVSSGIIVFELWRRYRRGDISFEKFKNLTFRTLGTKGLKYAAIFTALAVPDLNIVVGSYLLASFIINVNASIDSMPTYKPFKFATTAGPNGHQLSRE